MQSATDKSPFPPFPENKSDSEVIAETGIVRLKSAEFIRLMVARYGVPWIAAGVGLLSIAGVLAAVDDVRWLLIIMMVIFLVFPFMATMFYFNHGLKEVSVLNAFTHRLIFIRRGVVITLYDEDQPFKSALIPYSQIDKYYIASGCVIVPMKICSKGFLWIPTRGFDSVEGFRLALEAIGEGIRKTK